MRCLIGCVASEVACNVLDEYQEDVCNSILLNLPQIFSKLDRGYINVMCIVSLR